MGSQRTGPRFTGGFGGFLPPPDLPPLGDYEAPTSPRPSLTVYPGGGRQSSTYNTPPDTSRSSSGYESVSQNLFADDTYSPRSYSPGREFPSLPQNSSPPDPAITPTPTPNNQVQVNWTGSGSVPYWESPSAGGHAQSGRDISGFGGGMMLGQFLNTPLALMRFGTDRFQPGNTPNIQSADEIQIGTTSPTGPTGSQMWNGTDWVDAQPPNPNAVPSPDRTDPAFIDPGTELDSSSSNNPVATGNGRRPAQVTGNSPLDARFAQNSGTGNWIADQTTKAYLLAGGDPGRANNPGDVSDEGHLIYGPGQYHLLTDADLFGVGIGRQWSGADRTSTPPDRQTPGMSRAEYLTWLKARTR